MKPMRSPFWSAMLLFLVHGLVVLTRVSRIPYGG